VTVYESFPALKVLGDIISFGPNAGRIITRWGFDGSIAKAMRKVSIDLQEYGFNIHKWTGELMCNQASPPRDESAPMFNGHRGELHEILFNHVKDDLGVPIHLGSRVTGYFENEDHAGITLGGAEGEEDRKVTADIVIGSDGVRSKARELVLGYTDAPKSSGYAVFRAWFDGKDMLADPETKRFCENGDTFNGWIGPDVHFLFSTIKNGTDCCWVLTHKDDADIDESWSFPGKLEDVYKVFEGWDPLCKKIVSKTPEERIVDWKLVYRDPLPTWISKGRRIALLGDSAHPFLPTSAQGATQAMEDGVSIAVCLRRSGKEGIREAVGAYEDIR
jgi:2-polyprenyl-6-methoxyphenol hydroxylase-like FAD-dependent oxidoreductase